MVRKYSRAEATVLDSLNPKATLFDVLASQRNDGLGLNRSFQSGRLIGL
jgi:hypothetical protein